MLRQSRTKKAQAEREKQREERLVIFRNVADVFRLFDTLYRFFRMML